VWGLGFFWVYYALVYHWFFYMYPLDFLGLSAGVSLIVVMLACFGVSLLQAVTSAFLVPLFLVASRGRSTTRFRFLTPFLAAALWCVMEWSLTLTWAGVPWSRLALGQTSMLAVIQSASLFGPYFITFLIVAVNFLVGYGLFFNQRLAPALGALLLAVNVAVGGVLLAIDGESTQPLRVAAVQGNISSAQKWGEDGLIISLTQYTELTQLAAFRGADLVVWPESVIPYDLNEDDVMLSYLGKLASSEGIHLVIGSFEKQGDINHNALFAFDPQGQLNPTAYAKRRLVPFGEFIPMEKFIKTVVPLLADLNARSADLDPGEGSNIIHTELGNIGGIICFDSIYEELSRASVLDGAQLLVISTNDSWFSDSAALSMHNRQSVLRAVENGRYVIRAANTGISSIISPTGEILDSLGALENGIVVKDVYLRDSLTLYTRMGNVIVWLSVALYLAVISFDITRKILSRRR
jgi:apolipoprotein N-acyltransferase